MSEKVQLGKKKVFKLSHGRIIYYDYRTNRAYTIPADKQKQFPLYQNRWLTTILVVALMCTFDLPLWVSLGSGLVLGLGLEYFFRKRYLPSFTYTDRFDLEKALRESKENEEPLKKTLLRMFLYTAFAIVLVLNAYDQQMSQQTIILSWVISLFMLYLVGKMLFSLITSRKEN